MSSKILQSLIKNQKNAFSLQQPFYTCPEIFKQDIQSVWRKNWLFAGHSCELKKPGDYILYNLEKDSAIITRGTDGKLRSFHNVCRHRGSQLCQEQKGNKKAFVCPYHQWSYDSTTGNLKNTPFSRSEINKEEYGLFPVKLEEMGGLIFLAFDNDTDRDFQACRSHIENHVDVQGMNNAKIAVEKTYIIESNWKLVYENNRECLHCHKGHPEYISANYDTSFYYTPDGGRILDPRSSEKKLKEINDHMEDCVQKWQELGLPQADVTQTSFPGQGWYKSSRVVQRKGFDVESMSGKPVVTKPLATPKDPQGKFWKTEFDLGSFRMHTLPNFWVHCSSDHAVTVGLTPINANQTKARVSWLVNEDAVEDVDYNIQDLTDVWKYTAEQDWELCEVNSKGVQSSVYQPGPYLMDKEYGVNYIVQWYLREMKNNLKEQV